MGDWHRSSRSRSILAEHLGVEPREVQPEANILDDLGADSLDVVEMVMALESAFDIEVPDAGRRGDAHDRRRRALRRARGTSRVARPEPSAARRGCARTRLSFCAACRIPFRASCSSTAPTRSTARSSRLPPLRAPDGTPTNAALGFANMLLQAAARGAAGLLRGGVRRARPDLPPRGYADYKADARGAARGPRGAVPARARDRGRLSLPMLEVPGFEADDVIATLVRSAPRGRARSSIVSTDRDLMQLVDERVQLLDGIRDRRYGPAEVEERFGVPPAQVLDLRALVGDTSDNIPGVKGIGEKGAAQLIARVRRPREPARARGRGHGASAARGAARAGRQARLSSELATLRDDAPVAGDSDDFALRDARPRAAARALSAPRASCGCSRALDAEEPGAAPPLRRRSAGDADRGRRRWPSRASARRWPRSRDRDALRVSRSRRRADDGAQRSSGARMLGLAARRSRPERARVAARSSRELAAAARRSRRRSRPCSRASVGWLGRGHEARAGVFARARPRAARAVVRRRARGGAPRRDRRAAASPRSPRSYLGRKRPDLGGSGGARRARRRARATLPRPQLARWAGGARAARSAALRAPLAGALERDGLARALRGGRAPAHARARAMERAGVRIDEGALARARARLPRRSSTRSRSEIYALGRRASS